MHIGDHVRQIDGIPVGRKSVDEATTLLQSNKTERIQLEIFPVSAQVIRETHLCCQKTTTTVLGKVLSFTATSRFALPDFVYVLVLM